MANLQDIRAVHWQPALGSFGVVETLDDIDQAIRVILATPKGSNPHRPDFGSNVWKYIDHPVDQAIPHVVRETVEAIKKWEPRCALVRVEPFIDGSHVAVRVVWKVSPGIERETKVSLWRQ
ncbi:MAG: GPW/gp25 family protein [Proteobacteria bacterium]|jgi:phage baseplate assembly protein W|nr:GPW/gp25 family protein [Pseudomonadota bacterium]